MKQILLPLLSIFALTIFLGQGCTPILNQDEPNTNPPAPTAPSTNTESDIDTTIDDRKPIYEDFTQAKYEAAIAAGDPVYLYFFATWCPTCRAQAPINERLFNTYNGFVHAFRINILDNEVNNEEEAIAKQFNVNRQHTAVLIDKSGNEAKRTVGTRSNTQLINDLELITQ
jgi:thioredoxin 1